MANLRTRAELIVKWRFTEGRRDRAVWIDGQPEAYAHRARLAQINNAGSVRRLI